MIIFVKILNIEKLKIFSVALKLHIFALMVWIYVQTLQAGKKRDIPYRLVLKSDDESQPYLSFNFRPPISISKKDYELQGLDRLQILSAPPFCDLADDLIEVFKNHQLVFLEVKQFLLLKSQFKIIGYNFNVFPKYLMYTTDKTQTNSISDYLKTTKYLENHSLDYAERFVELMVHYYNHKLTLQETFPKVETYEALHISEYKLSPGVYFFLDELQEVIYVGKASQIRKRLQSHFSNMSKEKTIDYSKVKSIQVDYCGNDILAQLIESAHIKQLKPIYNTQQVEDPAPYIINKTTTASGINKLQITRKDITDNLPERYFNRVSVKQSLQNFCNEFDLCRKHCGIEKVKGPCSKVTREHTPCVCADKTLITAYNERFEDAFRQFKNRKSSKIYKLKGRHHHEDAFIYMVNGIYEGYGFIDKSEVVLSTNDILGHLIRQSNNYDTSRIVSKLDTIIPKDDILTLYE